MPDDSNNASPQSHQALTPAAPIPTMPLPSPSPVPQYQQAPPPVPPPISTSEPLSTNEEANKLQQQIEEAKQKQHEAELKAQEALKQVKESEDKAIETQKELEQQIKEASKQVHVAHQQIDEAKNNAHESQLVLEQARIEPQTKVAGYSVGQIAQAFTKPPLPASSSADSPAATIDKDTRQELEKESKKAQEQAETARKQIEQAEKQIKQARQLSQKNIKESSNITSKIDEILKKLSDASTQTTDKPYKLFMIIGGVLLVIAILTSPFFSSYVWVIAGLAAIMQLAMGTILKRMS